MPPALMALLCLGLSMRLTTPVQAGTLPKPTLWAEPGPMTPWKSPVIIWCQRSLKAQEFPLDKEGSIKPWDRQRPLGPGNKAKFPITYMAEPHAGRYHCYYVSQGVWSKSSDPPELVVTGVYRKPSLSALPIPAVNSGENVTLRCRSKERFGTFVPTKEGEDRLCWTLDSQPQPSGQFQALFPVDPRIPRRRRSFRCYGCYRSTPQVWSPPSDALELLVSGPPVISRPPPSRHVSTAGVLPKPSIRAKPGLVIRWGQPVTIVCRGPAWAELFRLEDKNGRPVYQDQTNVSQRGPHWAEATFHIKAVSEDTARGYHCRYRKGPSWSEPSDILELKVAGEDVSTAPSVPGTSPEVTPHPQDQSPRQPPPQELHGGELCLHWPGCCGVADLGGDSGRGWAQLAQVAPQTIGVDKSEILPEKLNSKPPGGSLSMAPGSQWSPRDQESCPFCEFDSDPG